MAVGGGSVIDTAKAVNLYTTYPPADFLDYVNAPIGKAMPVPGPLKPLIAIPTTAGTGSETTGVSIFDLTELHAKTGIASRRLKPTLGVLDPENTRDDAAAGGGVERARHLEPCDRVVHGDPVYVASPARESGAASGLPGLEPYQRHLGAAGAAHCRAVPRRAVEDPSNDEARAQMMLAASYAGVGFGNAGVHLPHGMSYPVSGQVKDYRAPGYSERSSARPARVLGDPQCAGGLPIHGGRQSRAAPASGRGARRRGHAARRKPTPEGILADRITWFMERLGVPNGLKAVGYTSADIPNLVEGTLPQHRVTKLSPRPAGRGRTGRALRGRDGRVVIVADAGASAMPAHGAVYHRPWPRTHRRPSGKGWYSHMGDSA